MFEFYRHCSEVVEPPNWDVLLCPGCKQCYGRAKGKNARCTRCGRAADIHITVVGHANSPQDLQRAISIANMPEQLRADFASKLPPLEEPNAKDLRDPIMAVNLLRKAMGENGLVTFDNLAAACFNANISLTPTEVIDWAEAEGFILRKSDNSWVVLE